MRLQNAVERFSPNRSLCETIWIFGLGTYLFLLPWQARYLFSEYSASVPFYGGLSLYVTDILFVILFSGWLILIWKFAPIRQLLRARKRLLLILLLFSSFVFVSIAWSGSPFIGWMKALRVLQAAILLLMLVGSFFPVRLGFLSLLMSGVIEGLVAIQQFFTQTISANTWLGMAAQDPRQLGVSVIEYADQRWLRAYGTLPHPNILGSFLAVCSLLAAGWFLSIYRRFERAGEDSLSRARVQVIASLSAFLFCFLGLLLTFSRSAWLGFAVGFVVLVASMLEKKRWKWTIWPTNKLIILGALFFLFLNVIFGPLWLQRVHSDSRLAVKSSDDRAALQSEAAELIKQHPARGLGIGQYVIAFMQASPDQPVFAYQPVHNTWLMLWAELGLVGLLPFIGALLFFLWWMRRRWHGEVFTSDEAIALSLLTAIILMMYYEHFWWSLPFGLLLTGTILGFMVDSRSYGLKPQPDRNGR